MFGNDLFEQLYDHLDQAVSGGAAYVKQSAEAIKKGVASSLQWIWEALQGDFNPNQVQDKSPPMRCLVLFRSSIRCWIVAI